jgi:hypothetical protein
MYLLYSIIGGRIVMKKVPLMLLSLFLVAGLCSCGSSTNAEENYGGNSSDSTPVVESNEEDISEDSNESSEDSYDVSAPDEEQSSSISEETTSDDNSALELLEKYNAVLDRYRAFCADPESDDTHGIEGVVAGYYQPSADCAIYYTYLDVDKNGTDELLVGMGSSSEYISLVALYGFDGSDAVLLLGNDTLGDRSQLTIYDDGVMYVYNSGGASYGSAVFNKLDTDGYTIVVEDEYTYDDQEYPQTPFYNDTVKLSVDEFYSMLDTHTEVDIKSLEWNVLDIPSPYDDLSLYSAFADAVDNLNIISFLQDDFNNDGEEEAFGITGIDDGSSNGYYPTKDVKVYYVDSSSNVKCVFECDSLCGIDESRYFLMTAKNNTFFAIGGSDGDVIYLFGVKDGECYQPNISGEYLSIESDEDDFYAYEFNDGGFPPVSWQYDEETGEFVEVD